MPRFLLVTCERGTLVSNAHAGQRRYCGKPKPGPVWAADEQPIVEVVQDDASLRKAHRGPDKFEILKEGVFSDIMAAREGLMPKAPASKPAAVRAPKAGDS